MVQRPGLVAGIITGIFRFFKVLFYFWIFLFFLFVVLLWDPYFPFLWCFVRIQKFKVYCELINITGALPLYVTPFVFLIF